MYIRIIPGAIQLVPQVCLLDVVNISIKVQKLSLAL
jgi:hypothetical protein